MIAFLIGFFKIVFLIDFTLDAFKVVQGDQDRLAHEDSKRDKSSDRELKS